MSEEIQKLAEALQRSTNIVQRWVNMQAPPEVYDELMADSLALPGVESAAGYHPVGTEPTAALVAIHDPDGKFIAAGKDSYGAWRATLALVESDRAETPNYRGVTGAELKAEGYHERALAVIDETPPKSDKIS